MKNTRQQIIDYVKSKNIATIYEISQAMNITPANARYHVHILARQGILESTGISYTGVPRRPPAQYCLAAFKHRHNLELLSTSLLGYLVRESTVAGIEQAFRELALILLDKSQISQGSPSKKLYDSILFLNRMNYAAHWEAHAATPRIVLTHCPYIGILAEHPELCLFDKILLETMTNMTMFQKLRLEKDKNGSTVCLFLVNPKSPVER